MFPMLPRLVSRTGFQGCLASIDLNGEVPDPTGKDVPVTSNHVVQGCDGTIVTFSSQLYLLIFTFRSKHKVQRRRLR